MFFLRYIFCLSISFSLLFAPQSYKDRKPEFRDSSQQRAQNVARRNKTEKLSDEELCKLISFQFKNKRGRWRSVHPCPIDELTSDVVIQARCDAKNYLDRLEDESKERPAVLLDLWHMRQWLEAHGYWNN